jgi:hypothetical protein
VRFFVFVFVFGTKLKKYGPGRQQSNPGRPRSNDGDARICWLVDTNLLATDK